MKNIKDRLDEDAPRKNKKFVLCSQCSAVELDDGSFLSRGEDIQRYRKIIGSYGNTKISHSYCPPCEQVMIYLTKKK